MLILFMDLEAGIFRLEGVCDLDASCELTFLRQRNSLEWDVVIHESLIHVCDDADAILRTDSHIVAARLSQQVSSRSRLTLVKVRDLAFHIPRIQNVVARF